MNLKRLIPLTLCAVVSSAMADGFYGVGEVTHSMNSLDRGHFDSALTANGATALSSSDKGSGNQWRLQGGYRFNKYLAAEVGYIDFGKAKYKASYTGGSANGSLKAGGFNAIALASLPLGDQFSIFGKAGIVAASVKSSLPAVAGASHTETVISPLVGVGATYKLTDHLDLRADYDYVSGLGKSNKTGKMDSNMVSMGVAYNF